MRDGWKKVKGRGDELRYEREDDPTVYVRIGGDGTVDDATMAERLDDAMRAAEEVAVGRDGKPRAEAPPATMTGE